MDVKDRQHIDMMMVETAKEILKNSGYCVDNLWHVSDVNLVCEEHNLPVLSQTEAMKVFAIANEHFDGEEGFSWPGLERAIFMYFSKNSNRHPRRAAMEDA